MRWLYVFGGLLFLVSAVAHLYVRIRLRRCARTDLDECYYEFEDDQPEYAAYAKWLRITLSGAVLGVLMLFLAVVL